MPTIEMDIECRACGGTGLYQGMAEGPGVAVVCHKCNGTGCYHYKLEYKEFMGLKPREGIRRVLQTNPGIAAGEGNGRTLEDFGGISYEDWRAGKEFGPGTEMRRFVCPARWFSDIDSDEQPDWCREEGFNWGMFSHCPAYDQKEKCWERWDKQREEEK